jgi:hypothetical protein
VLRGLSLAASMPTLASTNEANGQEEGKTAEQHFPQPGAG